MLNNKGFTLIEILVSVMVFTIVMTVALGALLAMSDSDRRAEALKSVVNNLDFALDSMSRTIRTGYSYHCGTTGSDLSTPGPQDCSGAGQSYFAFRSADNQATAYCLASGIIYREIINSGSLDTSCGSSNFSPMTSSEINITNLQFVVTGSCPKSGTTCTGDSTQPKVTLLISGAITLAGSAKLTSGAASTTFNVETSVTQRIYDQ